MGQTLFVNVSVLDGTGAATYAGEQIRWASKVQAPDASGSQWHGGRLG